MSNLTGLSAVTLHGFLHSLRCSRAVSLTPSCYFAWVILWGDIVTKQAYRLHDFARRHLRVTFGTFRDLHAAR